jgi:hypothetical protein
MKRFAAGLSRTLQSRLRYALDMAHMGCFLLGSLLLWAIFGPGVAAAQRTSAGLEQQPRTYTIYCSKGGRPSWIQPSAEACG